MKRRRTLTWGELLACACDGCCIAFTVLVGLFLLACLIVAEIVK